MPKLIRGIIYLRTSPSGKYYVGQTIDENRRNNEWSNLKRPYSGGVIDTARKKYGPENFKYEILFEIKSSNIEEVNIVLNDRELYFIDKYNSTDLNCGYNLALGNKYMYGKGILSRQYYVNKSVVQLTPSGKFIKLWVDIYEICYKLKLNSSNILRCCKGYNKSSGGYRWIFEDEYSLLDSTCISTKDRNVYGVVQLDLEGNPIKFWKSPREAEKELGINYKGGIGEVCKQGSRKTCGGFRWVSKIDFDLGNYDKDLQLTKRTKSILQYSIDGKFIKEFDSAEQAEDELKTITQSKIREVCNLDNKYCKSAGGFRWIYKEDAKKMSKEELLNYVTSPICKYIPRSIVQFDLEGNIIKIWDNPLDIDKTELSRTYILKACNDNNRNGNFYKGYRWMYKDDFESLNKSKLDPISAVKRNLSKEERKIIQLDLKGNVMKIWDNIASIIKTPNLISCSRASFTYILKGENSYRCSNYIWRRYSEYLEEEKDKNFKHNNIKQHYNKKDVVVTDLYGKILFIGNCRDAYIFIYGKDKVVKKTSEYFTIVNRSTITNKKFICFKIEDIDLFFKKLKNIVLIVNQDLKSIVKAFPSISSAFRTDIVPKFYEQGVMNCIKNKTIGNNGYYYFSGQDAIDFLKKLGYIDGIYDLIKKVNS